MFEVYEVNTGVVVHTYHYERFAWAEAAALNFAYTESDGLEYSVRRI